MSAQELSAALELPNQILIEVATSSIDDDSENCILYFEDHGEVIFQLCEVCEPVMDHSIIDQNVDLNIGDDGINSLRGEEMIAGNNNQVLENFVDSQDPILHVTSVDNEPIDTRPNIDVKQSTKVERVYICEVCGRQYKDRSGLFRHNKDKHIGKKFACQVCDAQFTRPGSVNRHMIKKHMSKLV